MKKRSGGSLMTEKFKGVDEPFYLAVGNPEALSTEMQEAIEVLGLTARNDMERTMEALQEFGDMTEEMEEDAIEITNSHVEIKPYERMMGAGEVLSKRSSRTPRGGNAGASKRKSRKRAKMAKKARRRNR